MLIAIDKSSMSASKKSMAHDPKLNEYINAVAMLKPLCNFIAGDSNVSSEFRAYIDEDGNKDRKLFEYLSSVGVYENGEHLGDVGIQSVYRKQEGGNVFVYFVESFRITKERGHQNRTFSKHLKVALREVNKAFIPREDQELIDQVSSHVGYKLGHILSSSYNQVRYTIDCDVEAMNYAYLAYKAQLRGEDTVTLPSKLASANNNPHKHYRDSEGFDKRMAEYEEALKLTEHYAKKTKGFAVQARADKSFVVCNYDNTDPDAKQLAKYKSIDDMPKHLGDKVSALKLLDKEEAVGHIGVKFGSDGNEAILEYYYLVSGDIIFE